MYKNYINYLFAGILLAIILFHSIFPELVQEENGLGWDGEVYATMIKNLPAFIAERKINPYYFQRIFPGSLVFAFLAVSGTALSDSHIIAGFLVLNILLLCTAFFFWIKLCQLLQLGVRGKILSFIGIFINYAILKMPFYYPVLTDLIAFTIGMIMLYCFLKNYTLGLLTVSIIGAFSFPTLFYCGMLLYIFPRQNGQIPQIHIKTEWNKWLAWVGIFGFVFILWFVRLFKNKPYINPAGDVIFAISLVMALCYIYFVVSRLVQPTWYFQEIIKSRTWRRVSISLLLYILIRNFTQYFASPEPPILNYKGFLANIVIESIANPLVFIVAHFVYFGPFFLLLLYYWKPFFTEINKYGIGLHLFVGIYVLAGIGSESRQFINAWPTFVLFLCVVLEKQAFSSLFYCVFGILSLVISKLWFRINKEPFTGEFLDFPYQWYFMSQGPWMSDAMYWFQGSIGLLTFGLIYFLFLRKAQT